MREKTKSGELGYVDILQKEISYFIVLAEVQNISKASEILSIQQSGLSRALARLEEGLGLKLFQRKNNGLSLTSAGEQYLKAVKITKKTWDEAYERLLTDSENPSGAIVFGFYSSFGKKYFPGIVRSLNDLFPQLEIDVRTLSSAQITRMVNQQEIDFGIVVSQIKNPEIVRKKIGSDYIAAFQKDPLETPQKVLINPDTQISSPILRKHQKIKKIQIRDYDVMATVCRETNSLALLPYTVAERYPDLIQVSGAYLRADVSLITHKEQLSNKTHRKIFDAVVNACNQA